MNGVHPSTEHGAGSLGSILMGGRGANREVTGWRCLCGESSGGKNRKGEPSRVLHPFLDITQLP